LPLSVAVSDDLRFGFVAFATGEFQAWDLEKGNLLSSLILGSATGSAALLPRMGRGVTQDSVGRPVQIAMPMPATASSATAQMDCRLPFRLVEEELLFAPESCRRRVASQSAH
jgi:hypothetical protein